MTYEEAIQYWFGRINYEQCAPRACDLKLDRMHRLLDLLGNPHEGLRIVHVAGSKGKGSTSAMLAAVLKHAGYRTGLFTSPHLCRAEERIQIDEKPIDSLELSRLVSVIQRVSTADDWTFFEIATALGFMHFANQAVDVAVVEVGLGGRFDSTNVCRPLVSVITSISLDHTQQLGNRLASIAMEKAGIIKPGGRAISGVSVPEARHVIEKICSERKANLRQMDVDFRFYYEPAKFTHQAPPIRAAQNSHSLQRRPRVRVETDRRAWPEFELGLLGQHQGANAAVAIATIEELRDAGFEISDPAVNAGLSGVRWPARLEVLEQEPLVILDCAHNVASAEALAETLLQSFTSARRLLIFAGSNDKDMKGMLGVLAPHFDRVYLTRYLSSPRSVPPEQLAQHIGGCSTATATICQSPAEAWQAACEEAQAKDVICIAGSVFLAGEFIPIIGQSPSKHPQSLPQIFNQN